MGAQISLDQMQNLNFLEGLRVEVAIDILITLCSVFTVTGDKLCLIVLFT